jgi:hypothetical protein
MNHPTFSSETIQAICEALQRAGVEFAFGIRDVSVQVIDRAMPRDARVAGSQRGLEARTCGLATPRCLTRGRQIVEDIAVLLLERRHDG